MPAEPGWDASAEAWIAFIESDKNRSLLLDPVMLREIGDVEGLEVLDVGCGEGRFCRMLRGLGARPTGLDPTQALISAAKSRDPGGTYVVAGAQKMPFPDESFDIVVSYVSLIDIPDYRSAIREMARVLRPGGRLLIANLNPFVTSQPWGWYRDAAGERLHYPVKAYDQEVGHAVAWAGISIINWHRPMSAYMQALLGAGLRLTKYLEPTPKADALEEAASFGEDHGLPFFHVMEWVKD